MEQAKLDRRSTDSVQQLFGVGAGCARFPEVSPTRRLASDNLRRGPRCRSPRPSAGSEPAWRRGRGRLDQPGIRLRPEFVVERVGGGPESVPQPRRRAGAQPGSGPGGHAPREAGMSGLVARNRSQRRPHPGLPRLSGLPGCDRGSVGLASRDCDSCPILPDWAVGPRVGIGAAPNRLRNETSSQMLAPCPKTPCGFVEPGEESLTEWVPCLPRRSPGTGG